MWPTSSAIVEQADPLLSPMDPDSESNASIARPFAATSGDTSRSLLCASPTQVDTPMDAVPVGHSASAVSTSTCTPEFLSFLAACSGRVKTSSLNSSPADCSGTLALAEYLISVDLGARATSSSIATSSRTQPLLRWPSSQTGIAAASTTSASTAAHHEEKQQARRDRDRERHRAARAAARTQQNAPYVNGRPNPSHMKSFERDPLAAQLLFCDSSGFDACHLGFLPA